MKFDKSIEAKWQKEWKDNCVYSYEKNSSKPKFYTLEMFSYPSGANLHIGHWYNYSQVDSYARFKRMNGFNVFHPMGFDAFGLPAENYAIKTGVHPKESTVKNMQKMTQQLIEMGTSYDFDYSFATCDESYYKWTQWLFVTLYKNGLAYKKYAPVNWCPSCKTVLANEQVEDGKCERCKSLVTRKKLNQWFFKTTAYAQELLDYLPKLNWPESTKKVQTNWIGRSQGSEIDFKVENSDITLTVFTTRADTLYGVTYVVCAPESDVVDKLTTLAQKQKIEAYRQKTLLATEIDRMSVDREKTGEFTGSYAINPINGRRIPIYVSDYVIEGYGSGCVMAVPAHDERDFGFAKKYDLPIQRVIRSEDGENDDLPYCKYGILTNSAEHSGLTSKDAINKIVDKLAERGLSRKKVNYKLKDWLVSRQRYWGAPIPVIYCEDCGEVLVDEKDLPVKLPYNVDFTPDGESPLAKCKEFVNTTCPKCGKKAKRDVDTLDTFVCSSWYYLRYPDCKNDKMAFDKKIVNEMLPVDVYVGGKEHAAMHLIYARFVTKALRDAGYLNFDEPFTRLLHQGMILGTDGNKMSKSNNNGVSPDSYLEKYGSDVFRLNLLFSYAFSQGGKWSEDGLSAMAKFIERIGNFVDRYLENTYEYTDSVGEKENELLKVKNNSIKKITNDTEQFGFNTSVSAIMVLLNALNTYVKDNVVHKDTLTDVVDSFVKLLAPFAPHLAEEIWHKIGHDTFVHLQKWPTYSHMKETKLKIPVQVNGKVRAVIEVGASADEKEVKKIASENDKIKELIDGNTIKKEIYIKGKIYNIVI